MTKTKKPKVKRIRTPKVKSSVEAEELTQMSDSIDEVAKEALPQPDPLPNYDKKFKPIHEYVVECDPDKEWPAIKKWLYRKPLSLKNAMEMLAEQPEMAMRSKRLALLANKELERFTLDFKERTGILRDLALDAWEERKRKGMHKQITNEMIEDWIVEHYGDTWTEMKMRLRDMKNAYRLLEQLNERVINRAPDLRKDIDAFADKKADPAWFTAQKQRHERRKK